MPNYVMNRIHLNGDSERILQMLKRIQNERYGIGTIDFEKILPMPSCIRESEVIEWRTHNWWTKWNACDYDSSVDYSKSGSLDFLTAWSAPHPVIKNLSEMFPDIEFVHEWAEEDLSENCGRCIYSHGRASQYYFPETESEQIKFSCGVWEEPCESTETLDQSAT